MRPGFDRGKASGRVRAVALAVLLGTPLACATGTSYQQMAATLPPIGAGACRIFVYRPAMSGPPAFQPEIAIDGETLGGLRIASFFYVDRPAGIHRIAVPVGAEKAAFEEQGATRPVSVAVGAGDAAYVRVGVDVVPGMVQVQLMPVSAADAGPELAPLDYASPEAPP
jgi:hypothetical protein